MHSQLRCACALIHSLLFLVAPSAWTAGGLSTPAMAQTWTGASSASWHDPANWSPPVVPGPADAAVIRSGPVTISQPIAVRTLTLGTASGSGATLTLSAPLTVTSELRWNAGIIQGTSTVTIPTGGLLDVLGVNSHRLQTRLINFGQIRINQSTLSIIGTTLDNHGTIALSASGNISREFNNPDRPPATLINHPDGLITATTTNTSNNSIGAGSTGTPPLLHNLGGSIHINSGVLRLEGGIFDGGQVTGPGELLLQTTRPSAVQIGPQGLTADRILFDSMWDALEGPGMLTVRNQLRFGIASILSDLTILPGAEVRPASGSAQLALSGNVFNHGLIDSQNTAVFLGTGHLINFGTVRIDGNPAILGYIQGQPPATIVNTPTGTLRFVGSGRPLLTISRLHNEGLILIPSGGLAINSPVTLHGGSITADDPASVLTFFSRTIDITAPSHLAVNTEFLRSVAEAQNLLGPSTLSATNITLTVQGTSIPPGLLHLTDSRLNIRPINTTPTTLAHITLSGRSTLLSSLPTTARVTFTPDPALTNSLTLPANFSSAGELTLAPPPIPGTAPLTLPLIAPSGFTNTGTLRIRPGISADMQGPFIQSAAGRTILTAPMGTPAAPALILAPGSTLGGTLALELPSGVPAPTCVSPLTLTSALRIPDPSALALSQLLPPPLSPAGLALRLRADPAQPTDLSLILAPLADLASIGGATTPDGLVTGDDFTAFLTAFAASDPLTDLTGIGNPATPPDGLITGDDFIAFIAAFATGCP